MAGNIQDLKDLINSAQDANLISSVDGSWAFNPVALTLGGAPAGFMSGAPVGGGGGVAIATTTLTEAQQLTVQNAIQQSNDAAQTTPQAVVPDSAPPVGSNQPDINAIKTKVAGYLDDPLLIGKIGDDIAALHGNASGAKLHWWGWEAQLNETGTKALIDLLGTETTKLGFILAAFAGEVPVLAAIGGILAVVGAALSADVSEGDNNGNGVSLRGYLWVGLAVHAL